MKRSSLTVTIGNGHPRAGRYDANHLAITKAAGSGSSMLSFESSGVAMCIPAEDVVGVEFAREPTATWCPFCDGQTKA